MCHTDEEQSCLCNTCYSGETSITSLSSVTTTGDRTEAVVMVDVSFDGAWQKRGHAHSNLTGCGAAIGIKFKKILSYSTRKKRCATCHVARHVAHQSGRQPQPHDCRMNWAMEASIACEVEKDVNESRAGVRVGVLVGDGDASTIKKNCSTRS